MGEKRTYRYCPDSCGLRLRDRWCTRQPPHVELLLDHNDSGGQRPSRRNAAIRPNLFTDLQCRSIKYLMSEIVHKFGMGGQRYSELFGATYDGQPSIASAIDALYLTAESGVLYLNRVRVYIR